MKILFFILGYIIIGCIIYKVITVINEKNGTNKDPITPSALWGLFSIVWIPIGIVWLIYKIISKLIDLILKLFNITSSKDNKFKLG